MPLLSIIVPVYNVEKYITQCLDSIILQDFEDYEVVIIDDGSTDHSGIICDFYAQKSSKVIVIHQKNRGLVGARKAGLAQANGQYLGFVDPDDYISSSMYKKMCNEAEKTNADIVICDYISVYEKTKMEICEQTIRGGSYNKKELIDEMYPTMLFNGKYYQFGCKPAVWNKIYRKEIILECEKEVIDCFRIGEDVASVYHCLLKASRVSYLKGYCGYFYRQNPESMTHQKNETDIYNIIRLLDFLRNQFGRYPEAGLDKQWIYYCAWMFATIVSENIQHGIIEKKADRNKAKNVYDAIRISDSGKQCRSEYIKLKKVPAYHKILLYHLYHPDFFSSVLIAMYKIYGRISHLFGKTVTF